MGEPPEHGNRLAAACTAVPWSVKQGAYRAVQSAALARLQQAQTPAAQQPGSAQPQHCTVGAACAAQPAGACLAVLQQQVAGPGHEDVDKRKVDPAKEKVWVAGR